MQRATTLAEIKRVLDPRPLRLDELSRFFVETSDARDPFVSRRDQIAEIFDGEDDAKVLLVGHSGTGKTTELVKLRSEHQGRYAFVQLSITEDGEPGNASVEVLLVLIVERILRDMKERGVALSEKTLGKVYGWFDEAFEIRESDLRYTGSTGGGFSASEGLWGKLLGITAYLKADIRTGSAVLSKTISRENRRLPQLATQCGLLVKEAQTALRQQGLELLLIIEDLDKISVADADALFIENPTPLSRLPTKAIFTAPIFLLCSPRATILKSHFKIMTVPMIKTEDLSGDRYDEGWKVIEEILAQRVDLEACIDSDALDLAIRKTGGVLRHLFEVLHHAATVAGQAVKRKRREEERILRADVRYGLDQLKTDLLRRIGVMGLPKEFDDLKTSDLYDRLRKLKVPRRVEADRVNLLLMQAQALLEYNGKQWHRVHPLVAEHLEE
jgi:hypothetical protein